MHVHILGICGTFMAGIATLARAMGMKVTGSDAHAYPPMSEQLAAQGITVRQGYDPSHLTPAPDCVVVGNVLSRGNPAIEHLLDSGLAYASGPGWLAEHVLRGRWVLAVAGTHGKTTASSMLAWILEHAGRAPGFLIGGVPQNFGCSARLGAPASSAPPPLFVVEADEYDTAFFDKRSKFVHYHPRTLVINNLEYDHADIFDDLPAIRRQFHHLVRTVPASGLILRPAPDPELDALLAMGCWTPVERFGEREGDWQARLEAPDGSRFAVRHGTRPAGVVSWPLFGRHNVMNALAAIGAAHHVGVDPQRACAALGDFLNVRRRLEVRGRVAGITVYDDFAHHPTAIRATLEALRARVGTQRVLAILEPASNTMRLGVHENALAGALAAADAAWVYEPPETRWNIAALEQANEPPIVVHGEIDAIIANLCERTRAGDSVLIMSNGAFGGLHDRLLRALDEHHAGRPSPPDASGLASSSGDR